MPGKAGSIPFLQIGLKNGAEGQLLRGHGIIARDGIVRRSIQTEDQDSGLLTGTQGHGAVLLPGIGVDAVIGHPHTPAGGRESEGVVASVLGGREDKGAKRTGLVRVKGLRLIVGGYAVPDQLKGEGASVGGDGHAGGVKIPHGLLQGKGHLDCPALLRGILHLIAGGDLGLQ